MPATNRIRWDGLDELRAALRMLPQDLATEGEQIVFDAAEAAVSDIDAGYSASQKSGSLRSGLDLVKSASTRFGAGVLVINRAQHAWLYDYGSHGPRSYTGTDKLGRRFNDADRGTMPAKHVFVPPMITHRARMYDRFRDLLQRQGLLPVGEP